MKNLDKRLLEAVSDRIATAKESEDSALKKYRFQIAFMVVGIAILGLLIFLVLNQEKHTLVSQDEAGEFCLKMARENGNYSGNISAKDLSLEDHERYHTCLNFHVGKDSELIKD